MAFKGDLTNISLFDVFQTLNQNRQVGVLVLQREAVSKKIYIAPEGVRIFFTRSFRPLRLGEIFVRRGLLSAQDVEILLLEQKRQYRPIGQILVESGKVTQEQVDRVLRYHAEDEIFEVFGWEVGTFAFYDGQDASDPTTPLSDVLMDPAGLCLEAARRLDEMERLREVVPDNAMFLTRTVEEASLDDAAPATVAVWDLLANYRSIDEMRDLVGLSLYDTLRSINWLIEMELIRELTVEELVDAARMGVDEGDHERAAQLYELAHQRAPDDRIILEECVEAVHALGEPRRIGRFLAKLGGMSIRDERTDDAVDYLEQALRSDPANIQALLLLREAFTLQGDIERATETALKVARAQVEAGDLAGAAVTCEQTLVEAPHAISLRYYLGQLYLRADRPEEGAKALRTLIEELKTSRKAGRSDKMQDLVGNCYRLLLKVDPSDEESQAGLRNYERQRAGDSQRRTMLVRGGIASAVVALLAGVGLTLSGSDPSELMARIDAAHSEGQGNEALELIDDLIAEHPESAEVPGAMKIRTLIHQARDKERTRQHRERSTMEAELEREREQVKAVLADRHYRDGIAALGPLVKRVNAIRLPQVQASERSQIAFLISEFLERIEASYKADRQLVASAANQLRQAKESGSIGELRDLEQRIGLVRAREWSGQIGEAHASLARLIKQANLNSVEPRFAQFRKALAGAEKRFEGLDALHHAVIRERLRIEITARVGAANKEGKARLRECEFEKARELYQAASDLADSVKDMEPRRAFQELLQWLESRRTQQKLRMQIEKIDHVVATIKEIEERKNRGEAAIAFRLLRDLVSEHMLIEFERKYRMPFAVESSPRGADVYVNGARAGKTPCNVEMGIFKRTSIKLKRDGFHDVEESIDPKDPKVSGVMSVAMQKRIIWNEEINGNVEADPVIAGNRLLVATSHANLLAFNLTNGRIDWDAKTGLLDRITSKPLVVGKEAYLITVGGRLSRIRLRDGEFLGESLQLGGRVEHNGVADGRTAFIATRKPSLIAVRAGRKLYEVPLGFSPSTNVVLHGHRLYIGTADQGTILVHDQASGKELTRFKVPSGTSFFGGLSTHGDLLIAGAEDEHIYAFNTATGKSVWNYDTGSPVSSPAISFQRGIYVARRNGALQTLNAKGERVTRIDDIAGSLHGSGAVHDHFFYGLSSGRAVVFDLQSESIWWDKSFDGESPRHVVAGSHVTIVITDKPWVYAFASDRR